MSPPDNEDGDVNTVTDNGSEEFDPLTDLDDDDEYSIFSEGSLDLEGWNGWRRPEAALGLIGVFVCIRNPAITEPGTAMKGWERGQDSCGRSYREMTS